MSDFPVINIKSEEDISMLIFHLNRGDKVGFTVSMEVDKKENWRLMNMIWEWSREVAKEQSAALAA
jgi:hypothetical protein